MHNTNVTELIEILKHIINIIDGLLDPDEDLNININ